MKSSLVQSAIVAIGILAVCHVPGWAGLPNPSSWRKVSADGRYVLVMVSPLPVEEDRSHNADQEKEIREIRSLYEESGLYSNDGSRTPLWTIPYFDWTCEPFIAPDGKHVAILHNAEVGQYWMMIWFFASGKEIASHDLSKLVPMTFANRMIYREGPYCHDCRLDETGAIFSLRTNYEDELRFDVASGRLVRRWSPWPMRVNIFLGAFAFLIAMLVFAIFVRVYQRNCKAKVPDARDAPIVRLPPDP